MGAKTGIEWTDATWNPLRGCGKVSDGCRNCYAESMAYRFSGVGQPYEGLAVLKNGHASWTGKVELVEEHLLDPLRWGAAQVDHQPGCVFRAWFVKGRRYGLCKCPARGKRIFVNSMSDLFHESVPDEWIDRIFAVMALCPQHVFQVLTKRPKRMLEYLTGYPPSRQEMCWRWHTCQAIDAIFPERTAASIDAKERAIDGSPLDNVCLGVSVENQATADERIPLLLQTPAAVRFISGEPLLGQVDLENLPSASGIGRHLCALSNAGVDRGALIPAKLDWVICGGESGPHARPMHPDWARGLRDQCKAAGVAFFFKQWGEWLPKSETAYAMNDSHSSALSFSAHGLVYRNGRSEPIAGPDKPDPEFGLTCWDLDGNDGAAAVYGVGKHAAGALLDGVEHREFPAVRA